MPDNENEAAPVAEKPKRTRTKKLDMMAALVGSMETIAGQTAGASGVTFDPPGQDASEPDELRAKRRELATELYRQVYGGDTTNIEVSEEQSIGDAVATAMLGAANQAVAWVDAGKRTIADLLAGALGGSDDLHVDAAARIEAEAIAAAAHLKLPAGADDWYRRGATGQAGPVRRQVGFGHAGAIYQDDFPNRQAYRAACALWRSGRQWAIREGRTFTTRETA